jgi:hypothetical protein
LGSQQGVHAGHSRHCAGSSFGTWISNQKATAGASVTALGGPCRMQGTSDDYFCSWTLCALSDTAPRTSIPGKCVPRCTQPFVHLLSAPQAYLNGIDVPSIFLFKTLVVKLTGSVGAVAGGLAVGKEGPFVHAGASQLMALFLNRQQRLLRFKFLT